MVSVHFQLRAVRKIRRGWKHAAKNLETEWPESATGNWPHIVGMVAAMQDLPEDEPAELEACSSSENFDFVVSSQSSHYRRWQPLGTSMSRRIRMRKQSLTCLGSLPQSVSALALSYAGLCHSFWDQGQEALKSLQGMSVVLDDEAHQKAGLFVQLGVITCQTGSKFTARLAAFSAFSSQGLGDVICF